jgi:hypothetical protein
VSILGDVDPADALRLTASAMRPTAIAVPPGRAGAVAALAKHHAILLAITDRSSAEPLAAAANAIEARSDRALADGRGERVRHLTALQVGKLARRFPR